MQSAAKHLAGSTNPIGATVLSTTTREMLRCALHDRSLFLFRNRSTELDETDLSWIADVLRPAGFSWAEAQRINVDEVAPVVISNLWSVAGVWIGFDEEPLYEAILLSVRRGPPRLLWSKAFWCRFVKWHLSDYLPKMAQHF